MDAARSLINMEASYFEDRQTGNLMSVLSADISLLEDVISDSSTSIVRITITFAMAAILLSFMSVKLMEHCGHGDIIIKVNWDLMIE